MIKLHREGRGVRKGYKPHSSGLHLVLRSHHAEFYCRNEFPRVRDEGVVTGQFHSLTVTSVKPHLFHKTVTFYWVSIRRVGNESAKTEFPTQALGRGDHGSECTLGTVPSSVVMWLLFRFEFFILERDVGCQHQATLARFLSSDSCVCCSDLSEMIHDGFRGEIPHPRLAQHLLHFDI